MGTVEPIREPNAVDQCIFALQFSRELNEAETAKLQSLKSDLGDFLPQHNDITVTGFELGTGEVRQHAEKIAGVRMLSENKECPHKIVPNRPDWQLEVASNHLRIHSLNYDDWASVKKKALEYIHAVKSALAETDVTVVRIILQVNDIFLFNGEETEYQQSTLFKEDSAYLTKHSRSTGWLWHVHQGWFEQCQGSRLLHVLNVGTKRDAGKPHLTIIEHVMQLHGVWSLSTLGNEDLQTAFDELHIKNKSIVRDLLCPSVLKRIGLQ